MNGHPMDPYEATRWVREQTGGRALSDLDDMELEGVRKSEAPIFRDGDQVDALSANGCIARLFSGRCFDGNYCERDFGRPCPYHLFVQLRRK